MSEIIDCLQSLTPKILDFPAGINPPSDPVPWALEMFEAGIIEADMQATGPASGDGLSQTILFFDQQDPASFERFRQSVQKGQPVHGNLALIDHCVNDQTVRENADWAWQAYDSQFASGMQKCHPLGSYLRASLWMSCGDHRYSAHCDLADGFLIHIEGHKHVRVWPVPKKHRKKVIFNHSDFKGRMTSKPIDFELEPGQILFIPSGAMHEVVAHGSQPAVSVSYHMGSPFPMLTLCAQLNKILQTGEVSLPPYMRAADKFGIYFFEPTRFINDAGTKEGGMPIELAKALAAVLQLKQVDSNALNRLLSHWWRLGMNRPIYQGPYPDA